MSKGNSNGPSRPAGELKPQSGNGENAPPSNGSSKPKVEPDRLSDSDHRILENAIRKSVSKIVDAGHPEQDRSASSNDPNVTHANPELDALGKLRRLAGDNQSKDAQKDPHLFPEEDPAARELPGAQQALAYRERLFDAVSDHDPRAHRAMIDELSEVAIPIQTLAIMLFAPVSARLGMRWCDDDDDFIQVAVAATRLNLCINQLSQRAGPSVDTRRHNRTVLLARTPGAMHTLGVSIVAACFRDLGWHVDGGSDLEIGEPLFERMTMARYDLLGISIGAMVDRMACAGAIVQVRAQPELAETKIAVGGPAVVQDRQAFETIGADIIAGSALEAIQLADKLVS